MHLSGENETKIVKIKHSVMLLMTYHDVFDDASSSTNLNSLWFFDICMDDLSFYLDWRFVVIPPTTYNLHSTKYIIHSSRIINMVGKSVLVITHLLYF